ncbi:hypothetical protein HanPI659440_Chr09g0343101 [Helianthus annuus]|nr:hypothetical protein HanPI659440_Chr09g0343101 [Helianthus annuus]
MCNGNLAFFLLNILFLELQLKHCFSNFFFQFNESYMFIIRRYKLIVELVPQQMKFKANFIKTRRPIFKAEIGPPKPTKIISRQSYTNLANLENST